METATQTAARPGKQPRLKLPPKEITVSEIAEAAMKLADGEVLKAARIMEDEIRGDEAKYRAVMDPLVSNACYQAVASVCHRNRDKVWTAPNYNPAGNGKRLHALAAGNLLMFPLPGGQYLGEATKAEVTEAADFYSKQANDMTAKSRWLLAIAAKLTAKAIVSKVFTEESLRSLQQEILHAK